ncbi:MAG: threonine synthase [Chloroflexota bacterium]|nr:threonine synthase [Chloroflexota bacterium]
MSEFTLGLRCLRCGREYDAHGDLYVCDCRPNVGSDIGSLDVLYDYARLCSTVSARSIGADGDWSMARYWPLLPIGGPGDLPLLPVGGTPLLAAPRLGELNGMSSLYIKDDGRNPTGSLKDRASAIATSLARIRGAAVAATASTGNAAAALAGLCASAGQPNVIFVPESAPPAKLAQLLAYGSRVLAVRGSYDDAFDLCTQACREFGWYNRNTGYNPYMTEGKKTVAYEIAEQLAQLYGDGGAFRAPDAVFVSVGDGCIIGGVYKGFYDLLALGWIERMPRLYGVQSTKSAALAQAWREGADVPRPVEASTRADSINVNAPRDAIKALRAVRESGGAFITVSDEAILAAIPPLARLGAVFAEPAGAAAYAGLVQATADGLAGGNEVTVVINTGSGLKDIGAAIEATEGASVIEPTLDAVHRIVEEQRIPIRKH